MKRKIMSVAVVIVALGIASCNTQYEKTKSGLVYKIFKGDSKDSLAKENDVMKFNIVWKIKDSVLFDSHGKMPQYSVVTERAKDSYNYVELLPLLKKGDSAVVIISVDTLFKKGYQQQFAFAKKGDNINVYMKVLDVFRSDSAARADANVEFEKDKPRQEQEMKEETAKRKAEMIKQKTAEYDQLKKSGEIDKEEKEILNYFAKKNITNYKKVQGTYVVVNEKGTGAPAVDGKILRVKYAGRVLETDSLFQANEYIFPLGQYEVIEGWDQGLTEFNEGGKGTLYIPGYLAYGQGGGPANKPYAALIFDVEVLNVGDTREAVERAKMVSDSIAAAKPKGK